MDKKNFTQILPEIVEFMRKTVLEDDAQNIIQMLKITKSFLLILDEQKGDAYKLALAEEFIEEASAVMGVKYDPDLEVTRMYNSLLAYVPVDRLTPQLVTFWMKKSCDARQLKNMQTLMLYSNNLEQSHIFNQDEHLFDDPFIQIILNYLDQA